MSSYLSIQGFVGPGIFGTGEYANLESQAVMLLQHGFKVDGPSSQNYKQFVLVPEIIRRPLHWIRGRGNVPAPSSVDALGREDVD